MIRLLICTIVSAMIIVELFGETTVNPEGQGENPGFELPQKTSLFKFPGQARDISIKGNEFWAIHTNNAIVRFNGTAWVPVNMAVKGGYFNTIPYSIAASPDGYTYATSENAYVYRWDVTTSTWDWQRIAGLLKQISASSKDYMVGVSAVNDIFSYRNGALRRLPGKARFVSLGVDNELWMIDMNNKINRWGYEKGAWEPMRGYANTVDVMNKTRAVMTSESNRMYVWDGANFREVGDHAHKATIDEHAVYYVTETDDIMMTLDSIV